MSVVIRHSIALAFTSERSEHNNSSVVIHYVLLNFGVFLIVIPFKTKGLVYDNEMLYFIVRASSVFDDSYSINFSVPDNKNGGLYTVSGAAGAVGSTTLDKFGELTTTRLVRLTANGEMGSSSNYATYSRSIIIPQENDAVIIKPLIKISEGGYTYELTSITTVE